MNESAQLEVRELMVHDDGYDGDGMEEMCCSVWLVGALMD